MSNKNNSSGVNESDKSSRRENERPIQRNYLSPKIENGVTNQKGDKNGSTGRRISGIRLAVRLFHNPLFSERGFKQVKEGLKSERTGDSISTVRCLGVLFLLAYPFLLIGYSIAGLLVGDKNNSIHVFFVYYSFLHCCSLLHKLLR